MSNLVEFAKTELEGTAGDEYFEEVNKATIALIELFAKQEHSGLSASCVLARFERLARFIPIRPLTGKDDEWNKVGDTLFQNRRCPSVFKDETGAYDIEGTTFEDPNGIRFQNANSRVPVVFPYTPPVKPEIIKVDDNGNPLQ